MKNIIAALAGLFVCASAFAEAPELKNMMPNSWKKLKRLSEAEERAFLQNETVRSESQKWIEEEFSRKKYNKVNIRVYSEIDSGLEFYRVLICNDDFRNFLNTEYRNTTMTQEECDRFRSMRLLQIAFMKDRENNMRNIKVLSYRDHGASNSKWEGFGFNDLMIKPLNDVEIGFFVTEVTTGFYLEGEGDKVDIIYGKKKQQQVGGNSTWFSKYDIKDDIASAWSKEGIDIQASSCLFDPKCPLRYSIQNAFDGDPATSYVENTEDDLMDIDFQGLRQRVIVGLAVINGFASNENLYYSNNRMADFQYNSSSKTDYINNLKLRDHTIGYQKFEGCFPNAPLYISSGVTEIYKGSKYNDTCIAELNFICSDGNYLFGEINE